THESRTCRETYPRLARSSAGQTSLRPLMSRSSSARALRVKVTQQSRKLDTLADPNYAAAWEVVIPDGDARSAEQWARATFEEAPPALRRFILAGWIVGLRLSLGPRPSPDH